jgi:hypothetical protein
LKLIKWTIATLSGARYALSATSIGKYALFGGGSEPSDRVDIWNSETNIRTVATLSQGGFANAATSVGNYALFGSGSRVDVWKSQVNTLENFSCQNKLYLFFI